MTEPAKPPADAAASDTAMMKKKGDKVLTTIMYWIAPDHQRGKERKQDFGNFFVRVINACNIEYDETRPTLSVRLNMAQQYVLSINRNFFYDLSGPMKKLVLVHEAGHIVQRHIERGLNLYARYPEEEYRIALRAVMNIAMDLAVNDQIVRLEPEFERCIKEFPWILPENYKLPRNLSFEAYLALLMQDPHKYFTPKTGCDCGESHDSEEEQNGGEKDQHGQPADQNSDESDVPGNAGDGGDSDESDDEDDDGNGGRAPPKQSGPGRGKPTSGTSKKIKIPSLDEGLAKNAKAHKPLFERMAKKFDEEHGGHDPLHDLVDGLTAEQAMALGTKIRRQTKVLIGRVVETTRKLRGFIPSHVQADIDQILTEEVVPWHHVLNDVIASQIGGKLRETMASPDLTLLELDHVEPFPGTTLDPKFTIGWLMDCSGSVSGPEFGKAVSVMNHLMAQNAAVECYYIECDARIQFEELTKQLEYDPTTRKRHGHGGTVYVPAFRRFLNRATQEDYDGFKMPEAAVPKIDLLVVATDGGVVIRGECFPDLHPGCPILWLVSEHGSAPHGIDDVPPDRIIKVFPTP
jgi:predicted metal-dependent peptidase